MHLGIFVRKGLIYIPVSARTDAGFYLHIEPIEVIEAQDTDRLFNAIKGVIAKGNPVVPTPDRNSYAKSPILKCSGIKSWSQFEKDARFWTLSDTAGEYWFTPWKKRRDRGSEPDTQRSITFPTNVSMDEIVRQVVATLQSDENEQTKQG